MDESKLQREYLSESFFFRVKDLNEEYNCRKVDKQIRKEDSEPGAQSSHNESNTS